MEAEISADFNQDIQHVNPSDVNQGTEPAHCALVNQYTEPVNAPDEIEDLEHAWRLLPACALDRVFSNLNFRERTIASMVCIQWSQAFERPCLWNSVNLCFSKGKRSRPCFNAKSIVQRFGRYFRHLGVFCRNERRRNIRSANRMISDFFQDMVLADVQLESFKMPRMSILTGFVNHQQLPVSESFLNFLRRQTGLATVDFTRGRTYAGSCLMILEALAAEYVEHLMLEGFFVLPGEILNNTFYPRYLDAITRFHHLRSLFVNYRYLTNEVVTALAENLDGHLEVLGIFAETVHSIRHRVNAETWNALKQKCPEMRVHYKLELFNMMTTHVMTTSLISPDMPVESMMFKLNPHWMNQFDFPLFEYLWTYHTATLRNVEFDIRGFQDVDVRNGAVGLVTNCPMLENLTFRVRFPFFDMVLFFDAVLDALQGLNSSLKSLRRLRMTFRGLSPERRANRAQVESVYIPRFRANGIQLKMKMKK